MKKLLFLLCFYSAIALEAQTAWKNIDYVYQEHIRTVSLLPDQVVLATASTAKQFKNQSSVSGMGLKMDSLRQKNQIADIPIAALNGGALNLSFDDMEGDFRYYRYRITYCNADWSPSSLNELEYIQGYSEDRLPDGRQSFGMTSNYTNYHLTLPNKNTRLLKSGNYLLHIYLDNGEDVPILTRRFCLYETLLTLQAKFTPTGKTEKTNTHHELDVTAIYKNINIKNPQREIKLTVLQNSLWASAKQGIVPNFHSLGTLSFDYQDSITFRAGREFRPFDLRSTVFTRIGVQRIESFEDGYDVTLNPNRSMKNVPYRFYFDVNGGFVIDNLDIIDNEEPDIRSEYPNVLFTLLQEERFENSDVYVIGKMTDWQPYPAFKMTYSEAKKAYFLDVPIKQGYYDYAYALVGKDGKTNLHDIDGDWYETENNYTILLYYRGIGERFDRLIGYQKVNSLLNR